ncbi:DNA polymerase I [Pasteuria penetrans]|uniref:DNA polymerase I n=1 Tax=Pasteuria penetrans TaxID=86005 RepID=UPI000FC33871|nr:DNA polymerase I [Pasteuria penetrans]
MKRLLLLDAYSVAFRAFFALPPLTDPMGRPIQAVYGFASMLLRVLRELQPTHVGVALDVGETTFRHRVYSDYKAQRQKMPDELAMQIAGLGRLFSAFGLREFSLPGYEADDIVGTLTRRWAPELRVVIVTGDQDLLQLVEGDRVEVHLMRKGVSHTQCYNEQAVRDHFGLSPTQLIDAKGLAGDASDHIPGVPGIGSKTALTLLQRFSSLENAIEHVKQLEKRSRRWEINLCEYAEHALLCKQLATIVTDAPLPQEPLDTLGFSGAPWERVSALFTELSFQSLLSRLPSGDSTNSTNEGEEPAVEGEQESVVFVGTEEQRKSLTHWLSLDKPRSLVFEGASANPHRGPLLTMALSDGETTYCVPWDHMESVDGLRRYLADPMVPKWVHDGKRSSILLQRVGWSLEGIQCDTFQAGYLLNPTRSQPSLASLTASFLSTPLLEDGNVYTRDSQRRWVLNGVMMRHIGKKAISLACLAPVLMDRVREQGLWEWLHDVEQPLLGVLAAMELRGVRIDGAVLEQQKLELVEQMEDLERTIYGIVGSTFNLNSPRQLATILFEKLGLPTGKRTKTGFSTDMDVLTSLLPQHEVIELIILYRQLGKFRFTYVEGLQRELGDGDRVHTTFQTAVAATGRLSSTEPNLQNIPIRLEAGHKIRRAFVPSQSDWFWLTADYSQIELRILAHLSQDEIMRIAFLKSHDVHTETAAQVFGVDREAVTPSMRHQAKAINFGIVYGMSGFGLSKQLNVPHSEACSFIDRYFATYPGIKRYQEKIIERARESGFVTTLLGRRRALPDLCSPHAPSRRMAERMAINTPVQGSAADLIKQAMVQLQAWLRSEGLQSSLLLQIHDELILEGPSSELSHVAENVRRIMENTYPLLVPLVVHVATGPNWYEAKKNA